METIILEVVWLPGVEGQRVICSTCEEPAAVLMLEDEASGTVLCRDCAATVADFVARHAVVFQ
jgi:formylmethanofuran dehydrogenase subunit E